MKRDKQSTGLKTIKRAALLRYEKGKGSWSLLTNQEPRKEWEGPKREPN